MDSYGHDRNPSVNPVKSENRSGITGRLIARNALLNLLGQGIPLLVGLVAMPVVARGLGPDRFGFLSLAWTLAGYFTLFDLGLGRASTRYVAEMLATGKQAQVSEVIWTSVLTQLVLGFLGTCALVLLTPALVNSVIKVPLPLRQEALFTLYVLALGVPVSLIATSLSGALEARQRFDLVNAVRAPSAAMLYVAPIIGVMLGLELPAIVGLIVMARALTVGVLLVMNGKIEPGLGRPRITRTMLRALLSFGGWVAVSAFVGPVLVYAERFLLSRLVSVAAVGYYSAPLDALTRLWLIPTSLSATLFPAFSELGAVKDREKMLQLFTRSLRFLAAVLLPLVSVIILFAPELLRMWLGPDFAQQSTMALRIATVGLLLNSLAQLPFALLQGVGRADITGKFHLAELPIYLVLAYVIIREYGITGAALAWTMRLALDALLMFVAAFLTTGFMPNARLLGRTVRTGFVFGAVIVGVFLIKIALGNCSLFAYLGLAALTMGGLYALSWVLILNESERSLVWNRFWPWPFRVSCR